LRDVDFTGKTVALYRLGDPEKYPENFVDALDWLIDKPTGFHENGSPIRAPFK